MDFDPDTRWDPEPPHLLFGPVSRWSYPTLINVVNPSSGGNVTVEGMPYDVWVYQYATARRHKPTSGTKMQ